MNKYAYHLFTHSVDVKYIYCEYDKLCRLVKGKKIVYINIVEANSIDKVKEVAADSYSISDEVYDYDIVVIILRYMGYGEYSALLIYHDRYIRHYYEDNNNKKVEIEFNYPNYDDIDGMLYLLNMYNIPNSHKTTNNKTVIYI